MPEYQKIVTSISIEYKKWYKIDPYIKTEIRKSIKEVFRILNLQFGQIEISILLTDDRKITKLNKEFRNKNKSTNVLSFSYSNITTTHKTIKDSYTELLQLGDIALSLDTIIKEAKNAKIPILSHINHMIIHGVLHILGYDHQSEEDALFMENTEIKILSALGIANPYKDIHETL